MNKAENGVAILSGVTVVTVTLSLPEDTQRVSSQATVRSLIPQPLKLLLIFRHRGLKKQMVPCNEK